LAEDSKRDPLGRTNFSDSKFFQSINHCFWLVSSIGVLLPYPVTACFAGRIFVFPKIDWKRISAAAYHLTDPQD